MVPHEEYETPIFNFYDDMVGEHYYSHLQQHPLLLYDDAHLHGCTYDMHLSHLKTHGFSCSTLGSFDVGGTSYNTEVNRFMIGEHFCFQPHTLLYIYDPLIHGCMGETSLSHLKSPCFFCSLFGSDLSGDPSFTSWMKEYMVEYFDAYHILLEQHYRTWDPHLCHWSKFDIILNMNIESMDVFNCLYMVDYIC